LDNALEQLKDIQGCFYNDLCSAVDKIKAVNPKTKEEFIVYYNAGRDSKTVSQKPDNILSICKNYSFYKEAHYSYTFVGVSASTKFKI